MELLPSCLLMHLCMLHVAPRSSLVYFKGLEPQAKVRGNTEEGLTHNNKCRDVKKGIRGQIMKIQPVIEHKTPNKGIPSEA